jgi:hypothetical protein
VVDPKKIAVYHVRSKTSTPSLGEIEKEEKPREVIVEPVP